MCLQNIVEEKERVGPPYVSLEIGFKLIVSCVNKRVTCGCEEIITITLMVCVFMLQPLRYCNLASYLMMTVNKNECWGEIRKNSQASKLNGILYNTIPTWRKLEANCVETK